ncbi:DUF1501 domain-containing protein [Jannaschia sp. W003]|uniref:DUF1501 domain-containing protein n=1 Tax=Jannaschia sp. W003 TaxID=2867012 RepID=UPI0021A925C1|nr:DUF1501 domain-containing protein [Jannaschia sp. W003]UWQ21351.1 DUF1501 domain-containing protein [Jannaschia sp. W003]
MDRRSFLLGCSLAASPLVTPISLAAVPGDRRLVVVILRGAMDGLDALQPFGDPALRLLRPDFAIGPGAGAVALTDFHAMHETMAPLLPWWREGSLGFVQAVSTPYRDGRSHFDGQDILEAGTPGMPPAARRDGWLNRLVGVLPGAHGRTAFAVGRDHMDILAGPAPHARWAPDAQLEVTDPTADLLRHVYHDDALFRASATEALALSGDPSDPRDREATFRFAAEQLRGDTRIATMSLGGWDTHQSQIGGSGRFAQTMRKLVAGLAVLRETLGPDWGNTAVLAVTEFGRTVAQNGTRGTDHGTGGAAILVGGALRGGRVWGDWPGLDGGDLVDGRDLRPTRDVRAYAAWLLAGQFGLDRATLEGTIFPGLEMGPDPRLLA